MKTPWESIVDTARGLSSDELMKMITDDPRMASKLTRLRLVMESAQDAVPENWQNRAKALVPHLHQGRIWKGLLVPATSGLQPGFRSATIVDSERRPMTFQFDQFEVILTIELGADTSKMIITGVVKGSDDQKLMYGTEIAWLGHCDDGGYFDFEAPAETKALIFRHPESQDFYKIELP